MMNEYDYMKKGLKFSLENIWDRSSAASFKTIRNRDWLFVRHDYLTNRYCQGASTELVKTIMDELSREGYLKYSTTGSGNKTRYMYSLSDRQKYIDTVQPERSFDPDEFFKASLYKAKETGVAPVPPEAHNDPRTSAFYHYDADGYEIF